MSGLHSVDCLIEDADLAALVSVSGPNTGTPYLVDLKHVRILVPRTEVSRLVKIRNTWSCEVKIQSKYVIEGTMMNVNFNNGEMLDVPGTFGQEPKLGTAARIACSPHRKGSSRPCVFSIVR